MGCSESLPASISTGSSIRAWHGSRGLRGAVSESTCGRIRFVKSRQEHSRFAPVVSIDPVGAVPVASRSTSRELPEALHRPKLESKPTMRSDKNPTARGNKLDGPFN